MRSICPTPMPELAADIQREGGTALPIVTGATDPKSVDAAAATVLREHGAADIVFNNAGVMLPGAVTTTLHGAAPDKAEALGPQRFEASQMLGRIIAAPAR
jgi:NAD(P)-dependent dehydrogenase (short-subunit alcohol dehydrogenase family)